jgi:hypothetical protein
MRNDIVERLRAVLFDPRRRKPRHGLRGCLLPDRGHRALLLYDLHLVRHLPFFTRFPAPSPEGAKTEELEKTKTTHELGLFVSCQRSPRREGPAVGKACAGGGATPSAAAAAVCARVGHRPSARGARGTKAGAGRKGSGSHAGCARPRGGVVKYGRRVSVDEPDAIMTTGWMWAVL